jgi:probable rRNA maturation factor
MPMIEVVNRQRRQKIEVEPWKELAEQMLRAIGSEQRSATIAFVSDKKIRELNSRFRGINKSTDVLSFPAEEPDNLGDIAISVDTAAAQSVQNGLTLNEELSQLMLHGLLHLSGYDHETDNGEMNKLELRLRKKLGL